MKLTTKSEYALLAMIYCARHHSDSFIPIDDICADYGIPRKYLEQLMRILKQRGYLQSRRGASGGYRLAQPADRISAAEIIRLMDGALAPTESVSTYFFAHTPLEKEPRILDVLQDIRDYISNTLENKTLADLV
jgi:Rrf2 family protein